MSTSPAHPALLVPLGAFQSCLTSPCTWKYTSTFFPCPTSYHLSKPPQQKNLWKYLHQGWHINIRNLSGFQYLCANFTVRCWNCKVGAQHSWGMLGQQGEPSPWGVLGRGIRVGSDPNLIPTTASSRADKYESKKRPRAHPACCQAERTFMRILTFRKVQLCLKFIWQFYLDMERPNLSSAAALKPQWLQEALSEWVLLSPTVFWVPGSVLAWGLQGA